MCFQIGLQLASQPKCALLKSGSLPARRPQSSVGRECDADFVTVLLHRWLLELDVHLQLENDVREDLNCVEIQSQLVLLH